MAKIKTKAQHAAIKHRGLMFASPSIRLLAEESRNVIFHCTRNNPVIKWLVRSAHKPRELRHDEEICRVISCLRAWPDSRSNARSGPKDVARHGLELDGRGQSENPAVLGDGIGFCDDRAEHQSENGRAGCENPELPARRLTR